MVKIAGSFLKIQDDNKKIKELEKVTDLIHYDVMDGKFTKKATRSVLEMKDVVTSIKKPVDIHLMVKDIKKYTEQELSTFWDEYKRLDKPHVYKVDLSDELYDLKTGMLEKIRGKA